jgi:hypothetical protein
MDDITSIMHDNNQKLHVVQNFRKYLQAVYSVEDSLDVKLATQKAELQVYRHKLDENMSYFKKIRANLMD